MNEDQLNIPVSDYPDFLSVKIKQTQSVEMWGDNAGVKLTIMGRGSLFIPAKVVFQILRGLISYQQKFYRRGGKK
jgi:hypothetical protein